MNDFDEIRQQLNFLPDEELIAILKNHDEEEWRPEVFDIVKTILSKRGISPDLSPDVESQQDIDYLIETLDLDFVTIGQYTNYLDAETDRLALHARGIDAIIINGEEGFSIQLQVQSRFETEAMSILAPEPDLPSNVPEEIVQSPCPRCGSNDITEGVETSTFSRSTDSTHKYAWFYACGSCGHRWAQSE